MKDNPILSLLDKITEDLRDKRSFGTSRGTYEFLGGNGIKFVPQENLQGMIFEGTLSAASYSGSPTFGELALAIINTECKSAMGINPFV